MKRILCFFITLVAVICISFSCKENNPVDYPLDGRSDTTRTPIDSIPIDSLPCDTIPLDTIPSDTIPVDSIPVDTVPLDSIPIDTVLVDTTIIDTARVHRLYLSDYFGVINVDETEFEKTDVRVELAESDSLAGKIKMTLYQVSFDTSMPLSDILLENVSADADGNIWCDSIAPIWLNALNIPGFNMPFSNYMVYSMRGQTYYDPQTKSRYYSTVLNIRSIGEARYLGRAD